MKRALFALLFATAGAAQAALPRVVLEAPLAPSAAPAAAGAAALTPASFAAAPLAAAGLPSVASPVTAAPLAAVPAALPALPTLAAPALGPKPSETSPAGAPSASPANAEARDELLGRLLKQVSHEDATDPAKSEALKTALGRMLQTDSGRALAERFLAEGSPAKIRFDEFEGSKIYETDGRKIFYAPRAFTEWKGDHVEIRVNKDYLGADEEFQKQDLPATLAHELLGHGLWYARADREKAFQAFHHHELNETNARLVGWLVDFELDKRFEESGAWSYLQDPAGFLAHLKLRLPYYALTFSNEELAHPLEALESRSAAAKQKRAQLQQDLANHLSWNPVIDHFARHHGIAESRLRALRGYMADNEAIYREEIRVMDALVAEVDATVGRMKAEPDRQSERYLQWAATHPMFNDLVREVAANTSRLLDLVRAAPPAPTAPAAAPAADDHWRGQVTFDELAEMYRRDREQNPSHWSR